MGNKQKSLKTQLELVLKKQLRVSSIKDIDVDLYITIATYVLEEIGLCTIEELTKNLLDKYLNEIAIKNLNRTRLDKVNYVLQLIIDWQNNEISEKCKGIEVVCDYCGSSAKLIDSKVVYGRSYGNIYLCSAYPNCDSYVGVHKGDNWPKGRLANAELRELKKKAHNVFDKIWRNGELTRVEAYKLLQTKMKLKKFQTHIGEFNIAQCNEAILICNEYLKSS